MGQAHLCQTGAPPNSEQRSQSADAGCSPWPNFVHDCSGAPLEKVETAPSQALWRQQRLGIGNNEGDSDCSSAQNSDGEDAEEGRVAVRTPSIPLVLNRQRVFSPHLQLKFRNFYKIEKQIGEGSYGSVFEAVCLVQKESLEAMKGSASKSNAEGSTGVSSTASEEEAVMNGSPAPSSPAPSSPNGNSLADDSSAAVGETPVRRVAVKLFRLSWKTGKDEDKSPRALERFQREVASRRASFERERHILAQLEHPHIVRMFECFEDRSALNIVMELCRGGELYVRIVQKARECRGTGGGFEEPMARMFFRQMLFATSYLHAHRIVHRDIKTENFLLLGEPGSREGDMIKLCDFGTAVQLTSDQPRAMERIGTLSYTAPEIYAKEGADTIADAWSLGVVLYVLLVGASPFRTTGEEPREETIRRIRAGEFDRNRTAWRSLSEPAKELIMRFLVVPEQKRLNSSDALRHDWVEPNSVGEISPVLPDYNGKRPQSPRRLLSPRCSRAGNLMNYAQYAPSVLMLITRFVKLHAMQQLTLLVCAQMLPEADLLNRQLSIPWYELFFALDADEDGRLSYGEFAAGLTHLLGSRCRLSKEQFYNLLRAMDVDCSGSIDWIEWVAVALLSIQAEALNPEPLCTAFRLLDRPSGDGMIGVADILAVINTDATGACLSATRGRRRVLRLLGRWATSRSGQDAQPRAISAVPTASQTPPSLNIEDFWRLLESVSWPPQTRSDEEVDMISDDVAVQAPQARRAAGTGTKSKINVGWCPAESPQQKVALKRKDDVTTFPWCQCQQPGGIYEEAYERVKEPVFVHQQSVIQTGRANSSLRDNSTTPPRVDGRGGPSPVSSPEQPPEQPEGADGHVARLK